MLNETPGVILCSLSRKFRLVQDGVGWNIDEFVAFNHEKLSFLQHKKLFSVTRNSVGLKMKKDVIASDVISAMVRFLAKISPLTWIKEKSTSSLVKHTLSLHTFPPHYFGLAKEFLLDVESKSKAIFMEILRKLLAQLILPKCGTRANQFKFPRLFHRRRGKFWERMRISACNFKVA